MRLIFLQAEILTVFLLAGCSASVEQTFTPRADILQLPEKHQRQIRVGLEDCYGTAQFPHMRELVVTNSGNTTDASKEWIEKVDRRHLELGRDVYRKQCAGCHGVTGDGSGPAAPFLDPPPRDYRLGRFKFASTPRGTKPRRADLVQILRRGAKGTSMPSFRWMPDDELNAVIDYVILLSSRGELEFQLLQIAIADLTDEDDLEISLVSNQSKSIAASWATAEQQIIRPLTPEIVSTPETIAAGAKAFVELNCYKCHGRDGRGAKNSDVGKDDWGRTAYAADLTTGTLHGGGRPIDIYRRIYSGINGTPMPSFALPDPTKGETETQRSDTIWHLTHFVSSVAAGKPLPLDVVDSEIRRLNVKVATPVDSAPGASPANPEKKDSDS